MSERAEEAVGGLPMVIPVAKKELRILESPSRLKQYDKCPWLMQLTYDERWEPKEAAASLTARLAGTAFAHACELAHTALRDGQVELLDDISFIKVAVEESIALFERQFKFCCEKEIRFAPNKDSIVKAELARVIPQYFAQTPIRTWQKVTDVETPIPAYGLRPDLGGIDHLGLDAVADVKYKAKCQAEYYSSTVEEFQHDTQFMNYNYGWAKHKGLVDKPVYSYLILVVGYPFSVRQHGFVYHKHVLDAHIEAAKIRSEEIGEIKRGERSLIPALTHRDHFGWCSMKKACLEQHRDREMMKVDYVQLTGMPD